MRILFIRLTRFLPSMFDHATNNNRSLSHRIFAGIIISFAGVIISKSGPDIYLVHIVLDHIGYSFHGIGLLPFISMLEKH